MAMRCVLNRERFNTNLALHFLVCIKPRTIEYKMAMRCVFNRERFNTIMAMQCVLNRERFNTNLALHFLVCIKNRERFNTKWPCDVC